VKAFEFDTPVVGVALIFRFAEPRIKLLPLFRTACIGDIREELWLGTVGAIGS
jgi:hypothetical protein